jgi:hypothetical protein
MTPNISLSAADALPGEGSRSGVTNNLPEVISYRVRTDVETQDRQSSFPFNKLVGEKMKKFSVLIALALLAVAGTGYAVTCAYDNVPGATLLVPYFRVAGTIDSGGYVTSTTTDTKISFVNVSTPGIIAHVTVWNKYSKAVLDFNVPMTGKDVVSFSMADVLNGKLNVNPNTQVTPTVDACGINLATNTYAPKIGWGQTTYIRFSNPASVTGGNDHLVSISKYATPDAFAAFRGRVMDSLDESGDIKSFQSSTGAYILDTTNPACGLGPSNGSVSTLSGAFSGYVTVDVVNYCTNFFPDQETFYTQDAIATRGWGTTYTPNVLIGDVFYVDATANSGNISGDQAVALEFDSRLNWNGLAPQTFFGRFIATNPAATCETTGGVGAGCQTTAGGATFVFGGDGREPLGDRYGFRYLSADALGLRTWILVWRGDVTIGPNVGPTANLCDWLVGDAAQGEKGYGFYDANHQIIYSTFDNDEGIYTVPGSGGPSGGGTPVAPVDYVFLEANRIDLLANTQIIPGYSAATGAFNGGWIDFQLRNTGYFSIYNQGWVGVQHTGPGTTLNVGYAATSLNGDFVCWQPAIFGTGNGVIVN